MSEYVNYDGLKRYDELIKNVISVKTWMGSCSTAAGTAAKVISVESGFKLLKGVRVGVKFTNSNTASNVTLNVNSTGAKSIYYNNAVYTGTSNMICGYANRYVFYVYDGTNWVWDGYGNHDNTTYSSKAAVANGTEVSLVTTGEKAAWNAKTSNTGTITGIKMNGVSKGTSGVVDLGTVITAHQDISGKVNKTTTVNGHALSGNVSVTASDVGLGNVGNFKAVSTAASQGLTDTEKSNARTNIGAGTSSFSGSYNDLTNKPTIPTVNNATLTIQKNGTTVKTFTANASSNVTANITVPTKVSELTNDSGYTTNTGTVTSVKVGTTSYSPSSGVVSLPAYPTSLPASDVYAWAKAIAKPSYVYSEIGYLVHTGTSAGGTLSLDGTIPFHVITLTGNVSALTLSANPPAEHSCHIILTSTAERTVAIAHDATNRVCPEAEDVSLAIKANGYAEINFLNADGKIYVRGI